MQIDLWNKTKVIADLEASGISWKYQSYRMQSIRDLHLWFAAALEWLECIVTAITFAENQD